MNIDLRLGDCLNIMPTLPDNSVDAVITDPPYERKYQHLYAAIATQAKRFLKPGGSYLAILPHYAVPEILQAVGEHLKYRWLHCMWQENGQHPRMAMGIEVIWKPIGWWVKDSWPQGRGFVRDGFVNSQPKQEIHQWEQALDWANFCLKMVPKGGTICDPLMGSGTVGVACVQAGYNFIGCEIDVGHFHNAERRIKTEQLTLF